MEGMVFGQGSFLCYQTDSIFPIPDMGSPSSHRTTSMSHLFPALEESAMEAGWTVRLEEDAKLK